MALHSHISAGHHLFEPHLMSRVSGNIRFNPPSLKAFVPSFSFLHVVAACGFRSRLLRPPTTAHHSAVLLHCELQLSGVSICQGPPERLGFGGVLLKSHFGTPNDMEVNNRSE